MEGSADTILLYNTTASSYDELYREEQYSKYRVLVELAGERIRDALILDVGCGTGLLAEYLRDSRADTYSRYICLDPSEGMLARLLEKKLDHRVIPIVAYAEESPLKDSTVDLVLSITAWGNIKGKEKALGELLRVARRGGLIIVSSHAKHKAPPPSIYNQCFRLVAVHIDEFYACSL
ncbi:MAG: class I SAM-dependent methyltransferase [Desulfurococcus sp.]|nr:class I SAM-dependent methyltransferase [Desulfurococcus sp.]